MTSPSAAKLRPAPTYATGLLLAALAMLVLQLATLGAGILFPFRVPGMYLTVAALHRRSWWRSASAPRCCWCG